MVLVSSACNLKF